MCASNGMANFFQLTKCSQRFVSLFIMCTQFAKRLANDGFNVYELKRKRQWNKIDRNGIAWDSASNEFHTICSTSSQKANVQIAQRQCTLHTNRRQIALPTIIYEWMVQHTYWNGWEYLRMESVCIRIDSQTLCSMHFECWHSLCDTAYIIPSSWISQCVRCASHCRLYFVQTLPNNLLIFLCVIFHLHFLAVVFNLQSVWIRKNANVDWRDAQQQRDLNENENENDQPSGSICGEVKHVNQYFIDEF